MSALPEQSPAEARMIFDDLLTLRPQVFSICLGFSRNSQDAEEMAQDVYLKAFRGLRSLRSVSSAREWLFRIARNTALDRRKRGRTVRFVALAGTDDHPDPSGREEDGTWSDLIPALKKAVAGLPKKLRDALVLREYGELSYEEIAAVLGTKTGTVMSRLHRARRALAQSLKEAQDGRR